MNPIERVNPFDNRENNSLGSSQLAFGKQPEQTANDSRTQGRKSLVNRWALFTYKGFNEFNDPAEVLDANLKVTTIQGNSSERKTLAELAKNPTASEIISYFKNDNSAIEYDWADFLYCKYYGKIPNNHLITVRRFPTPVHDNIYNKAVTNKPDLARCISWFGEETGNPLSELLGMDFGLNWAEMESDVQTLHSQKLGFGVVSTLLNRDIQKDENAVKIGTVASQSQQNKDAEWRGQVDIMDNYPNFVYGPINVINKMIRRDRGLNFSHEIKVNCEYSTKSYNGINPKMALLDILSNVLTVGFNNAPFWGGAKRYLSDNRSLTGIGDDAKLLSGDYGGYLESVGKSLFGAASNMFSDGKAGFGLGDIMSGFKKLTGGIVQNLFGNALEKSGARPAYQANYALLAGVPTGDWHISIGNPFNPIVMMGNMILDKTELTWSNVLGPDDFPTELKVTYTFKHGRPRDKGDIESMFNAGKGRMYMAAGSVGDVLNTTGAESDATYGNVKSSEKKKASDSKTDSYKDSDKVSNDVKINQYKDAAEKAYGNTAKFGKWTADVIKNNSLWARGA